MPARVIPAPKPKKWLALVASAPLVLVVAVTPELLARVLRTGLLGSPMPSHDLDELGNVWGLARYVDHLMTARREE